MCCPIMQLFLWLTCEVALKNTLKGYGHLVRLPSMHQQSTTGSQARNPYMCKGCIAGRMRVHSVVATPYRRCASWRGALCQLSA